MVPLGNNRSLRWAGDPSFESASVADDIDFWYTDFEFLAVKRSTRFLHPL
jgi:hypothetical protein